MYRGPLAVKVWGKHGCKPCTGTRAKRFTQSAFAGMCLAAFVAMPIWFFLLGL